MLPLPLAVVFVWRQSLFISLWLAQAGLDLVLSLLPSPGCWCYRCVPPCLVYMVPGMENGTLCTIAPYGRSLIGVPVHWPAPYTAASASGSLILTGFALLRSLVVGHLECAGTPSFIERPHSYTNKHILTEMASTLSLSVSQGRS